MSGVAATLESDIRAAFRAQLLALVMPAAPNTALTAAGRTLGAPGVDFAALGFQPGDYATTTLSNNLGPYKITRVDVGQLTFANQLVAQAAAGVISVPLPPVAWENDEFEPVPGQPFLEEVVRVIDSSPRGAGSAGYEQHTILATLALVYPAGQGTLGAESMVGRLKTVFRPGQGLSYGENAGTIMKSGPGAKVSQAPWLRCPFTVQLLCWTTG